MPILKRFTVFNGAQCEGLAMALIAPCRSGLHHTWPSDHCDSARSSWTLGCSALVASGRGNSRGSKMRVSAPRLCRMRAASSTNSRLKDRFRSDRTAAGCGVDDWRVRQAPTGQIGLGQELRLQGWEVRHGKFQLVVDLSYISYNMEV